MKNLLFILLTIYPTCLALGQQSIQYGSNNGKYTLINNSRIYYEEYGKGMPLLLLHGGAGSISDFGKVIPDLSKRFRVIAPDSPGHGRSEQSDSLSYQILADYFSKFIDNLKLDSVYIVGWSDGGVVALLLAADRPQKIKRVVVSGAQLGTNGYTESTLQMVGNMTPETVDKRWGSWVKDYQAKAPKGNNWKDFITDLQQMWNTKIFIPKEKVEKIESRTLIILGDKDAIKLEHGIEMYQSIKGSEFAVFPNTSHMLFDEQPDLFNKIGIAFLTKK